MYLINKHAPLGWFAFQWEDVQVSSGGEARLHHRNKGLLRDACDLRTDGKAPSHPHSSISLYVDNGSNKYVLCVLC